MVFLFAALTLEREHVGEQRTLILIVIAEMVGMAFLGDASSTFFEVHPPHYGIQCFLAYDGTASAGINDSAA